MNTDTIVSLSTPAGRGGIGVIRISGKNTLNILNKITENFPVNPKPRYAYRCFILNNNIRIEECLITFFKNPKSYTGEDLAEISTHSNPFLIQEILKILTTDNARQALAGEFTYRAFLNGKMDLIQAESINELINSNSSYFTQMKFSNLEGKLSTLAGELKQSLIDFAITLESEIEFAEEQFLDILSVKSLLKNIKNSQNIITHILTNSRFNDILSKGLQVVLMGKVNVGKSSLFNFLLANDRSIVSPVPGTTRDFIDDKIYLDGFPITISDIAGINNNTDDTIENEGIKRSFIKIAKADAVIFLLDASRNLEETDKLLFSKLKKNQNLLVCINKIDIKNKTFVKDLHNYFNHEEIISISITKEINLDQIHSFLKNLLKTKTSNLSSYSINFRQKTILEKVNTKLNKISDLSDTLHQNSYGLEILAEEIRLTLDELGSLLGEVSSESILNEIFSKFCIGK